MSYKNYNKIPFDKKIADQTLIMCDLFIELSKTYDNNLTLDQLIEIKNSFNRRYYNNKVELLQVDS